MVGAVVGILVLLMIVSLLLLAPHQVHRPCRSRPCHQEVGILKYKQERDSISHQPAMKEVDHD